MIGGAVDIGAFETPAATISGAPMTHPACPGVANGEVSFDIAGGCPPYTYQWTSAANTGSGTDHLPTGAYQFTITDHRGGAFTANAVIPEGSPVTLAPQSKPVVCGDTLGGTATAVPGGGQAPYLFNWQGSASHDSLLTGLAAGSYPLTVTDARGCTAVETVGVDKQGALQISVNVQEISCHGAADGSFSLTAVDGKQPYHWHWDNGPDSSAYGPLGPGTYNGELTDALGCNVIWVLPLPEPQSIDIQGQVSPASDTTAADGSIDLAPTTGGTQPYTALWSNGKSGIFQSNLKPGHYTVTLTDAHHCTSTAGFQVGFTVGTSEAPNQAAVRTYPNPATDILWIEAAAGSICTLYDNMGRRLKTIILEAPTGYIDLTGLASGVYSWRVEWQQGKNTVGGLVLKR
jgi:hypothetical protein